MPVISVRVDRRTYEALAKLAEARGVSLYNFVKMLLEAQVSSEVSGEVSSQVSCQVSSEVSYRELERKLSELTSKVSYLEERIRELLTSTAGKSLIGSTTELESVTTSTGNVTTTSGNVGQPRPDANPSGGYEWCKPRSSIKNLEGLVKYIERSLGLEDWWEEDDKICFRTRVRPAKT
jgi:hypothetical protein